MFKEMYEGIVEVLKTGPEDEIRYMKDVGHVPHFLNIVYGFEPTDIKRVKTIKIDGMPDILLVLAKFPEKHKNSKFTDYVLYEGKMVKMVLINMNDLMDEDPMVQMISIGWSIWKLVFTATEIYINLFEKIKVTHSTAADVLYYAPAVLMVKALNKLYADNNINVSDNMLSLVINNFYKNHKILPVGVSSIKKAIGEVDIEVLLDCSIWEAMIVNSKGYPGAAFADFKTEEVLKEVDDMITENTTNMEETSGESDTTNNV